MIADSLLKKKRKIDIEREIYRWKVYRGCNRLLSL